MFERLRNNAGLKLLAFALAVVAWAYLRFAANPAFAARFDQQLSVPIELTGLASGEVAHYNEKQVVATIVTPRDSTTPVRPDDLRAILNVAGKGPGVYALAVTLVAPHLVVRSISPSTVTLTLARVESRVFALSIRYIGDRTPGVVVGTPSTDPLEVLVRGASDELARVRAVRLDVPFAAGARHFDAMLRPSAVDADGNPLHNVEIDPNLVRVRAVFVATSNGR
jgi:YbbR domain-containing protein